MMVVPQCYQLDIHQIVSVQMLFSLWAKNKCFYGKEMVAKHISMFVLLEREDAYGRVLVLNSGLKDNH